MKIIRILTISFCIIILLTQGVQAFGLKNILATGEEWEQTGLEHTNTTMDTGEIQTVSSQLYNLLLAIAAAAAIIVGCILGIQFMTAGIDKKVEVQKSLFPYLISCVVAFGAIGIWKLIISIFSSL